MILHLLEVGDFIDAFDEDGAVWRWGIDERGRARWRPRGDALAGPGGIAIFDAAVHAIAIHRAERDVEIAEAELARVLADCEEFGDRPGLAQMVSAATRAVWNGVVRRSAGGAC